MIAHSQGTMIAYEVLRSLRQQDIKVSLFITMGSPLGLQELKDYFQQNGELAVPDCIDRWCNFADPLTQLLSTRSLRTITPRAGVASSSRTSRSTTWTARCTRTR